MPGRHQLIAAILLCASARSLAADEQPICADRPSKSTGPCTVPQGRFQLETGLVDWTRAKSDSGRADEIIWGSTAVKYGVSGNADIELWVTPLESLSIHGAGIHEHRSSFGDMLLRVKYAVTPDSAPLHVALDPFVKIPTANRQLGNGKVEGGLLVPVTAQLGKTGLTLSLDPELDLLADRDAHGRHLAMQQVLDLGASLSERVSVSAELWGQWDWDPAGRTRQASADAAIGYLVNKDVQLDAGANFGLNRNTPDLELYAGVSKRF